MSWESRWGPLRAKRQAIAKSVPPPNVPSCRDTATAAAAVTSR